MTEALCARDVSVFRGAREVVQRVSFAAPHATLSAIVGPNGAGKSTLLKAFMGILPCQGEVHVGETSLHTLPAPERARLVGYVPQQSLLSLAVSVQDVVAQGRFAHRRGLARLGVGVDAAVEHALRRTGTLRLRTRAFNSLSGGEQRRVLIARAIATEARVLLLDEPTAGLDVAHVLRFFGLIHELTRDGYAVIAVLHDLADVRRHAAHTLLLHAGRALAQGPTGHVLVNDNVASVYGVRLHENTSLGYSLAGGIP